MDERTIAALEDLAASPDLDRQPPASLFHLGLTLTDMARKPEQGAAVLRIAHERYPADFWINTGLALSLAGMGPDHQDEALGFNWAALALRPNDAFAWYRIGVIRQYHHKDLDKANFCYRKALVFGPNHTWVQSGVGQAFLHQNKYDEALVCIHKSLELDPSYAPAYTHLGDVLRAQKRLDEAVATYRKAIEINPKNSGSYYGLGLILLEQNKVDEAVDLVSKGVDHNPKNASFWWVLGRALHKQKKLDEAVAAFHKALAIDSKPATYHWGLAFTLRDQKKTDEAVAAFRKAVALDPKQAYATYGLGLALMDQKQPEEAIAVFRKTIELEPTRADAHQKLGNLLAEQGQVAEAIPCYRKAIELDPKSPWSRGNLAWHLATAADLDLRDPLAALEHARIATELQPASPIFWHNLGVALLRTGDAHAAVQMLEKSNQMAAPGDQRHFFLAMAYWQHGEQDQARQAYGQAVQWMDQHQPDNEALRRIRAEVAELLGIAEPDVTKVP
jgi:superkiller protein 3